MKIYLRPWYDEENAKRLYAEHSEHIRTLVSKETLREYNVKEGWGPLCEFLGEEVPAEGFPRVNYREQWEGFVGENAGMVRRVAVRRFLR